SSPSPASRLQRHDADAHAITAHEHRRQELRIDADLMQGTALQRVAVHVEDFILPAVRLHPADEPGLAALDHHGFDGASEEPRGVAVGILRRQFPPDERAAVEGLLVHLGHRVASYRVANSKTCPPPGVAGYCSAVASEDDGASGGAAWVGL